jgi:hypothetical protein
LAGRGVIVADSSSIYVKEANSAIDEVEFYTWTFVDI